MAKKRGKITRRFTATFAAFTVLVLVASGIATYFGQLSIYREQCQRNAYNICGYLKTLMQREGEDVLLWQDYFMVYHDEMDMPVDFDGYLGYEESFWKIFRRDYPGETLGETIGVDDLNKAAKEAYFLWKQAYWLTTFEEARTDFGIPYTYYVVPPGEPLMMTYVVDIVREPREDDPEFINLGITVEEELPLHAKMWEAWQTGKNPDGYDISDNEFGHTYGYFSPLIVNGKVIGVVSAEVEVDTYNREILQNTLRQLALITAVLIAGIAALSLAVNRLYIARIVRLEDGVSRYAAAKDPSLAEDIRISASGNDEISRLGEKTADMILELDAHTKELVKAAEDLATSREREKASDEMARRDPLTGIRNRLAYDEEVKKLKWAIADGNAEFGIAVIDLNFLKRINDTYGHEKGNVAIKNLCGMVCRIYDHSPVFRIGGDEFVVVLRGNDYEKRGELERQFNSEVAENARKAAAGELDPWDATSAALGMTVYDAEKDTSVENVFKRADKRMYRRKQEMKAVRTE